MGDCYWNLPVPSKGKRRVDEGRGSLCRSTTYRAVEQAWLRIGAGYTLPRSCTYTPNSWHGANIFQEVRNDRNQGHGTRVAWCAGSPHHIAPSAGTGDIAGMGSSNDSSHRCRQQRPMCVRHKRTVSDNIYLAAWILDARPLDW